MISHVTLTLHKLLVTYPEAEIILGGDRNELDLAAVTANVPNLKRIITVPTHNKKMIDVILMTLGNLYKQAEVVAPIGPDRDGAKPSDHKVVVMYPKDSTREERTGQFTLKIARPLPES